MFDITANIDESTESSTLAGQLTNRYGVLALTRAAGAASAAERQGNHKATALWKKVVNDLRQEIAQTA